MWSAESVYEIYREILLKNVGRPIGDGIFIPLEDLQERLALKAKDIPGLIADIRSSLKYKALLAKAPGTYRGRRYRFDGEQWVFVSMYKL